MHESAIAGSIFETVCELAKEHNGRPRSVTISCGQFNTVNDDAMSFAFEAITHGTICEGMKLVVVHKPLMATCKDCGHEYEFDVFSPLCGKCASGNFEFGEDAELLIENVELDKE
jgi:hydrogenase nickel incorporation protein HypA/HybF